MVLRGTEQLSIKAILLKYALQSLFLSGIYSDVDWYGSVPRLRDREPVRKFQIDRVFPGT
jgi:hypothetical protein